MSAEHATPQTSGDATSTIQNAVNIAAESKSSAAFDAVANHPVTQNVKNTVANGPVAENVKDQAAKTSNEFSNLSNARTTPSAPAATGQKLTHYHSFFSSLLSWDNPRASGIAYAAVVVFIFATRYLNLLPYLFRLTWITLGITTAAEIVGKTLFNSGFASQIRPRKYYVVPKETLDALVGDVHELINFFVIEAQRIVFAENIYASAAAFLMALTSYFLIKIVPFWGLALIGTSTVFLAPLIYKTNKEFIDHHLSNASDVIVQQSEQIKSVATQHATAAANTTKQYVGDYSAKAQEMIQTHTGRSLSPVANKSAAANSSTKAVVATEPVPAKTEPKITDIKSELKAEDFPSAPDPLKPFETSTPIANEFITAPAVGSTAQKLSEEPLLA